MNLIAIDPSINSTAVVINGNTIFNYSTSKNVFTKKGSHTKWYSIIQPFVNIKTIDYENIKEYNLREIYLLNKFDEISDQIINDINTTINPNEPTIIGIEGYSYSSNAGPLIDLVTFSTILRLKLKNISQNIHVLPPNKLKSFVASFTYEKTFTNKKETKWIYKNNNGISGGRFTKTEMHTAILDNNDISSQYIDFLKEFPLLFGKNIAKPFDDINDAIWIYYYLTTLEF